MADSSIIEWGDVDDGERFFIRQNHKDDDDEEDDFHQILMTRDAALQIAHRILETLEPSQYEEV